MGDDKLQELLLLFERLDLEDLPSVGPVLQKAEELLGELPEGPFRELLLELKATLEKAVLEEIPLKRAKGILSDGVERLKALVGKEGPKPPPEQHADRERVLSALNDLSFKFLGLDPEDLPQVGEVLKGFEDLGRLLAPREAELLELAKKALERMVLEEVDANEAYTFASTVLQALQRSLMGETIPEALWQKAQALGLIEPPAGEKGPKPEDLRHELSRLQRVLLDLGAYYDPRLLEEVKGGLEGLKAPMVKLVPELEAVFDSAVELTEPWLKSGARPKDSTLELLAEALDLLARTLKALEETGGEGPIGPLPIEGFLKKVQEEKQPRRRLLGEALIQEGLITEEELKEAFEKQKAKPWKRLGEILLEEGKVSLRDILRVLREQKGEEGTIAVQFRDLQRLTDLVGELAVLQAVIRSNPTFLSIGDLKFLQEFEQLGRITSDLQKTVMSMRMEPLEPILLRAREFAESLAQELRKGVEVELQDEGTEVEVERGGSVYELLTRALRFLVEESVEAPSERRSEGKDERARISIRSQRKTSYIQLDVLCDGRSLKGNREGLRQIEEFCEGLGGEFLYQEEAQGPRFSVKVPLSLVVVDGLLAKVSGRWYVIPTQSVREVFLPKSEQVITVTGREEYLKVREELIPFVRLNELFEKGNGREVSTMQAVIVEAPGRTFALLVDEVLGKQEFVIKALGRALKGIKGVVGGTIMGDGTVGLIVDPEELFERLWH